MRKAVNRKNKADAFGGIRHPKKRAFLQAVARTCSIVRAAAIVGIDRDNHYLWLKKDQAYAEAFTVAWERGLDFLEAEAVRRATEGTTKPVFHAGKRVLDFVLDENGQPVIKDGRPVPTPAVIREYSDNLLMFVLNGRRSRVYRQRLDTRFVDDRGRDRAFTLADADRLVSEADAEDGGK
jgi:hypothetical protein